MQAIIDLYSDTEGVIELEHNDTFLDDNGEEKVATIAFKNNVREMETAVFLTAKDIPELKKVIKYLQ